MASSMSVDTAGLRADAESIRTHTNNYKSKIEKLYEEVNNTVNVSDESKAWFGPRAGEFVQAVENLRGDFENIEKALQSAADELDAQANAWSNFEG